MAKVSLRIYNREIESIIEQGKTQEAIAHCHHILKSFPKHLETYRLLGKAHLESKRYTEAVDIFGRVLMSVPDDFVAHVGMSIIRDEENKLDDSIWHMERAFEAQPSNAAIQGELQRLYGRRDGMEPPKIRMTRGALAHMYVQGELYPQAIAEIRAVLAEDPQRSDMQVLLALAYFKGGQKSDATDMCNQLLKRYPYCFDANRILVELLPSTAVAAESTQVYRMRVGELDPYANFVKGSVFQSNEVADAAVSLDRLEYTGDEVPMGQEWGSSLGIGASSAPALGATTLADQPDWLKSGGFSSSSETPAATPASDDGIPDFLRAAGWGESTSPEQPTSIFDEEPSSGDLTPADLPDWLKGQVPSSSSSSINPPTKPLPDQMQPLNTPDWLSGLSDSEFSDPEPQQPAQPSNVPDWLSGLGDAKAYEAETGSTQSGDVSDWLSGLDNAQTSDEPASDSIQSSNVPDWLSGLGDSQASEPASTQAQASDVPDWMSGSGNTESSETPLAEANIPDWLSGAEPQQNQTPAQSTPSVESLGSTAQEQDDAVAWLESLAAKHGAKPEELVTDPNKRFDTPPEWVAQAQSIGESQAASSANQEPDSVPQPEAVENALNIGEQFFAEFENASTAAPANDETGMWLKDLEEKDKQGELTSQPANEASDIPEWLSNAEETPASSTAQESETEKSDLPNWLSGIENEPVTQGEYVAQNLSNDDLSNWLSGLDDEPGLPFEAMPTPDSILTTPKSNPPVSVKSESDLPDWLSDVDAEAQPDAEEDLWKQSVNQEDVKQQEDVVSLPTEAPATVTESEDLPDWLKGVDEKPDVGRTDEEDTPPWLHREQYEAGDTPQPTPTSPSDWHPAEQTSVPVVNEKPKESAPVEQKQVAASVPVEPPAPSKPAPAKKKAGLPAKQRQPEAQNMTAALGQAKGELDRGDIPAALEHYGKLIKKGKHLEETIRDLTDSLYRYPVEVGIWQTLGDAYMRANRLKEALESYNKAEELIR